jgi:hypothetical protein
VTNADDERPRGGPSEEDEAGPEQHPGERPEEHPGDKQPRAGPQHVASRLRSGAEDAARTSAAGVLRGSEAAVQTGVALAERGSRVTYWPAQLCVLGAILLQVRLPEKLTVGPAWLLPSLEGVLLIGLAATTPRGRADEDHPVRRRFAIGMIALVNAANAASLYLLAHELLHKQIKHVTGSSLILAGVAIWLTNVLIFALWYWQIDRGGPARRARHPDPTTPEGHPDWVFPEMDGGRPYTPASWSPAFLDYLALAVTTACAFGPADAMPNSQRAKALMSTQAVISLVTLGLIISRAVGILN